MAGAKVTTGFPKWELGIHRQIERLKMLLDRIAKYPNGPLDLKVWCCEKRLATLA
jgi:hypothetical protein